MIKVGVGGEPPTTSGLNGGDLTSRSAKASRRNGNGKPSFTSANAASNSNGTTVASEFKDKLDSLVESRAPISKEKMHQLVQEAIKSAKHYKHVVYYVESFIKKVSRFLNTFRIIFKIFYKNNSC